MTIEDCGAVHPKAIDVNSFFATLYLEKEAESVAILVDNVIATVVADNGIGLRSSSPGLVHTLANARRARHTRIDGATNRRSRGHQGKHGSKLEQKHDWSLGGRDGEC